MSTATWKSASSADWLSTSVWSPSPPGAADTALIAVPGAYDVAIASGETISIAGLALSAGILTVSGTLRLATGATIGSGATLDGGGNLTVSGTLATAGVITGDVTGTTLNVSGGTIANTGALSAGSGAVLYIAPSVFSNLSAGRLAGGSYIATGGLDFFQSGAANIAVAVDAAVITLSGPSGYFYSYGPTGFVTLEQSLTSITAGGVLNILGGRGYTTANTLFAGGLLTLGGGTLAPAILFVAAGGTLAGFGTVTSPIGPGGLIEAKGGTLTLAGGVSDTGVLQADAGATLVFTGTRTAALIDNGTIAAGPGLLKLGTVSGNGGFALQGGSIGALSRLELTGPTAASVSFGNAFGRLDLDAPAQFTGTISGFGNGDVITLAGIGGDGARLSGNTLSITRGGAVVDTLTLAGNNAGSRFSAGSYGSGATAGTAVTVSGPGLQVNFVYEPSVAGAPAGFQAALNAAAAELGTIIRDPITVNLRIGWGDNNGTPLGNTVANGGPSITAFATYAQLKGDLVASAVSGADAISVAHLPAANPAGGSNFVITSAQQKAWGMLPANAPGIDGSLGFGTQWGFNFDPANRAQPNLIDFVGVAEHEITHAIGRYAGLATNQYTALDLFRYSAPAARSLTATPSDYFSIDGGATNLDNFDTAFDPGDWASSVQNDSFGYGHYNSVNGISATDSIELDALGFTVACFAGGTRILTSAGELAVEALRPGMTVPCCDGDTLRIRWIGHRRLEPGRHPRPRDVLPVRVHAGAFGDGRPRRDLRLSPDHAVRVGRVLIPIRYLLNGRTIVQEDVDAITYWHVELERHAVLLADGLACESYLDTGNRAAFSNGGLVVAVHANFSRAVWAARGCAALVTDGPEVVAARRNLLARAAVLGHGVTGDAGLRVVVGAREVAAEIDGASWKVGLPGTARAVRLVSRRWVPAHMRPNEADTRILGVAIANLRLDGRTVTLDDPRLSSGWHAAEPDWRWTDGDAGIALAGVRTVRFDVAMRGTYWHETTCPLQGGSQQNG